MLYFIVFAYGITIVASTMAGGYLPRIFHMSHLRMQSALSFVGGVMLGVALLILLPHGFLEIYHYFETQPALNVNPAVAAIGTAMNATIVGLLFTFFMMRAFHFHQHGDGGHDHDHGHSHSHAHDHGDACDHTDGHDHADGHQHTEAKESGNDGPKTKLGWVGVTFGLGLHTFMDGIALGLAVQKDAAMLGGFAVYLAILLHKPLDAVSLSVIMRREGFSWPTIQAANAAFGLMCMFGAMLSLYLGDTFSLSGFVIGCLLSASAGVFLCISLSDLLPEVQFHRHDRLQLSAALICGISVAFVIEWFHSH